MMTEEMMRDNLRRVEADVRLRDYKPANVLVNAPLALIQVELATEAATWRRALGLPLINYPISNLEKSQ